jgi:hypothetical protein
MYKKSQAKTPSMRFPSSIQHLYSNVLFLWAFREQSCHYVTLPEESLLGRSKSSNDRVQSSTVVEQDEIAFLPIMRVDILWRDGRPLNVVHNLANPLKIVDDGSICQVQFPDGRRVDLDREFASDRVPPAHGQDLNLLHLNWREIGHWDLKAVRNHAQPVGAGLGAAHPDVGVRCVLDLCAADKCLVLFAEAIVHRVSRDESRGAQWDVKFIASTVIISACLPSPGRDFDSQQRFDNRRRKSVQRRVDVPAIKTREIEIISLGDTGLVEGLVVRVLQRDVFESFIALDESISNHLNLRLVWDRLKIRVQDGAFGVDGFAVPVGLGGRVEAVCEIELGPW